jgi:class 3 adenylate cyclase
VKEGRLHFEIIRNQSMGIRMGGTSEVPVAINPLPMDESSIAGFVATRQQVVYVPNVAEDTEFDFTNVRRYDASTGYRTRAMLVVPMIGRNNDTIGVLQLINPLAPDGGDIIRLTKNQTDIVYSFASQAAVALENVRSHEKIARKNIAFERFVPTEFLRFLGKTEAEEIKLGDASQQFMSVLFSDIRSFTDRSETLSAEQNFLFLNEYLEAIGPGIVSNRGFIDKYIGDAIMALFPGNRNGVADDAVAASIDMLNQLGRFNYRLSAQGLPPVNIGVGIHTGGLTLGTIGFEGRMETTVIGDTVNLASRMEGLTKQYGINIAISEATFEHLKEPGRFQLREIDTVLVKGKARPTRIYEVCDSDPEPMREYKLATAAQFAEGLALYKRGAWAEAIACFQGLARQHPEDRVLEVYLRRCKGFLAFPPDPGEWSGVTRLVEK